MKQSKKKRSVGRPRSDARRPVLALRVHEKIHEDLRAAAEAKKISMSEEAASRLEESFKYEAYMQAETNAREELEKSLYILERDNQELHEQLSLIKQVFEGQRRIEKKLDDLLTEGGGGK